MTDGNGLPGVVRYSAHSSVAQECATVKHENRIAAYPMRCIGHPVAITVRIFACRTALEQTVKLTTLNPDIDLSDLPFERRT